jgi:hypothetical protein
MIVLTPQLLVGFAVLLSGAAMLVWSIRRKR